MKQQNSTKKILYVHHDNGNSGASRSLSFLLEKLDPTKYEAKINCIFNGPVVNLFKDKPVEIIERKGIYPFHGSTVTGMGIKLFLENFAKIPSSIITSIKLIRKNKPDLIHINSSSLFIVAFVAKLCNMKIKIVCHVREPLLRHSISASIIKYMNYFFVDHFIAIDHYTGSSMKTRGNINIVYNSVDFNEYNSLLKSNIIRKELGIKENDIIFLYLARIAKCNGALELIRVANKLQKNHHNYHFILIGLKANPNDSYSKMVISEAQKNHNVHLMTFRNDVPALIADADILIAPFTQPHFARSIIEASAIAKPVIGANVGGVNELVVRDETGFLYDNDTELYNYCIELGENKNLRFEMGSSAFDFAKKNFDNNVNTTKVFEIYDKLLNEQ
ncbi:MAG: glycosyltransferase family 4 protein [Ginsengibacter sp.]